MKGGERGDSSTFKAGSGQVEEENRTGRRKAGVSVDNGAGQLADMT